MGSLIVFLIIAGFGALMFFKSTFVKSFAMLMAAIFSNIAAFGYFELLGNMIINKDDADISHWAYSVSFFILFILSFLILLTIASQIIKKDVEIGTIAEKMGRPIFGLFTGMIISGALLCALSMAPFGNTKPYARFDSSMPKAKEAKGVLFNADGFATGWFNLVSGKSMGGQTSFCVVHPDFISQNYLNRHSLDDEIPAISKKGAINVWKKKSTWPAPDNLKDTGNQAIGIKSGYTPMIARVGITAKAMDGPVAKFPLSQLSLICKKAVAGKSSAALKGKAVTEYPVGYLQTANQVKIGTLKDFVIISRSDMEKNVKWLDFLYYVPSGYEPIAVQFRQNVIELLPQTAGDFTPPEPAYLSLPGKKEDKSEKDKKKNKKTDA
ncbi:MAG: CvpA family protein [Planctomycetota bacterium]|jgi:hypothetical protein